MNGRYSYVPLYMLKRRLDLGPGEETEKDDELMLALETASDFVDDRCNRTFHPVRDTSYFSGRDSSEIVHDRFTDEPIYACASLNVPDLLSVESITLDLDGDGVNETPLTTSDYVFWPYNSWPKSTIEIAAMTSSIGYWPVGQKAVEVVGLWGYGDGRGATPWGGSGVTLTCDADDVDVVVSDGGRRSPGEVWLVGSEQMFVLEMQGTHAYVERAVNGTAAAVHATAAISTYRYPNVVKTATLMQAQRLFKRRDAVFGVTGPNTFGQQVLINKLDPDLAELLKKLVRQHGVGAI